MKHFLAALPGIILTMLVWSHLNGQISDLIGIIKRQNNCIESLHSKVLNNELDYMKKFKENQEVWLLHLKNQHGLK